MRTPLALLALVLAVAVAPAAATTAAAPKLRVADADPLVVRASGFAPRERVVVRAHGRDGVLTKRVRATAGGTFVVRFDARYDFCLGINLVRATGVTSGTVRIRPSTRPCVVLQD